jgi:ABC-type nitrate/sulfonate/bicarbonate transport system permease component
MTPRVRELAWPVAFLLIFGLTWETAVRTHQINRYLLPAPSEIAGALIVQNSLLWQNTQATLEALIFGLALALVTGLALGVVLFYSPLMERVIYPLMIVSRNIPYYAIAPLLVVWLGFEFWPKVIVAALIAFFPLVVNTHDGLKSVDPDLIRLMRALGAGRWQIFWKVRLPASLPLVLSGLKLGSVFAVVGVLFGELIGGQRWTAAGIIGGLGYLMREAANRGALDLAFAAMAWLSLISLVLFGSVSMLERYLLRWQMVEKA